jgi:putative ABC transport system ATP-binding protein
MSEQKKPAVELRQVSKSFVTVHKPVPVLKNVDLTVELGDFLVIFGPSGCGKSTLLHIILGLEPPTKGSLIKVLGKHIYPGLPFGHSNFDEDDAATFRKEHIGMVYQQTYWIKSQNVLQNVAFPLLLLGVDKLEAYQRSSDILKSLQMLDWAEYIPTELSSGQQQKINLARALITNPEIIIADEPTGNLDFQSGQELMNILVKLNQSGKTIIMVTHDLEYLSYAGKAAEMLDGEIIGLYQGEEKNLISTRKKTKKSNSHSAK